MTPNPVSQGALLLRRGFDLGSLAETRASLYTAMLAGGVAANRARVFVAGVCEGLNNAIVHGGGGGEVTLVRHPAAGMVVTVTDRGQAEPFGAPPVPPPPTRPGGRGLWIASQSCDRLTVQTGDTGTAVTMQLVAPGSAEPAG